MSVEELTALPPFRYVTDLLRHGFVVRRKGGRGGVVTYSELWREARFPYEIGMNGFGVYLSLSRWWLTPFGLPFRRLSDTDRQRILNRMQQYDRYEGSTQIGLTGYQKHLPKSQAGTTKTD